MLDAVLAEVDQLSVRRCKSVGIQILEPETEQLLLAGQARPGLSFRDRLCLIVAHELDLELVTNDRALRRHCESEGVDVVWGLTLLLELLERRHLTLAKALSIGRAIHEANSHHIGRAVLDEFERKARQLKSLPPQQHVPLIVRLGHEDRHRH